MNFLTSEQEEMLVCLYEEAAEVIQVVGKIERFGIGSYHPISGATNIDLLHAEVGDVLAIIARLTDLGVLSEAKLAEAVSNKLDRLTDWMAREGDNTDY